MNEAKEKTALCTSVGADERQSVQNTISSISALDTEINHPGENSPENFEDILRQMQRMSAPAYLHTVDPAPEKGMEQADQAERRSCLAER